MENNSRRRNEMPLWSVDETQRPSSGLPTPDENFSFFSNIPRRQLENYFTASLLALVLLFIFFVITMFVANEPNVFKNICITTHCLQSSVKLLDAMNFTVGPCDDFYRFACGSWKANYPADVENELYPLQSWTTELSIKQKKFLIGELRKNNSYSDPAGVRAVRRVFHACQNMAIAQNVPRFAECKNHIDSELAKPSAINTVGLTSLWTLLNKLGLPRTHLNATSSLPWMRSLGRVARFLGQEPLVGMTVAPSVFNSSVNVITFFSPEDVGHDGIFGGWTMDDVFPKENSPDIKQTNKWETHVRDIIKYLIQQDTGKLFTEDEELLLAQARSINKVLRVIQRAVEANKTPKYLASAVPDALTVSQFQKVLDASSNSGVSKLQIKPFLEEFFSEFPDLNVNFSTEKLAVYRMRYYRTLSNLLDYVTDSELELFIWWKVVYLLAIHTNDDLIFLKEKMLRSLSNGKHPPLSRESVCYYNVIQLMKPSFGYFVIQTMDNSKVHQVETIANNLHDSLISTIKNQQWVDETTRKSMLSKARAVKFFLGRPDWMNNSKAFDELYRSRGESRPGVREGQIPLYEYKHLENLVNLADMSVKKTIQQLQKRNTGIDEEFVPTLINAYYTFTSNSISVPYGILDLPVFGWDNTALNYGSTGGFIGHELTHAFDTIGRDVDEYGNFRKTWTTKSLSEHDRRTSCFVSEYSNFQVPSYYELTGKIDGNLTVQENMADSGGLHIAYRAYKNHKSQNPSELKMPGLQDFSHDQLFFLGYARAKCSQYTKRGVTAALQDVHPPDFVRVLAALRNSADFADAWRCPKGSFMNPEKKCRLWS